MSLRNKIMRKVILFVAAATILSNSGFAVHAQVLPDEATAAYEWSEASERGITGLSDELGLPVWTLRDTKDVTADLGTINLKSYTMTLLNDTRLCKGVTEHSGYFKGYVRARFETIFGEVETDSDSGRVFSYRGDTAETPASDAGGWNGIAHTYCGGH